MHSNQRFHTRIHFYLICSLFFLSETNARIWYVGPTRPEKNWWTIQAQVNSGDTISIDSALYEDVPQVVWRQNRLLIKSTSGFPVLRAGNKIATDQSNGKGIFVIAGNHCIIQSLHFQNCKVVDHNGAGIRLEGKNIMIRQCIFSDNEMGFLCGAIDSCSVHMEQCYFKQNGSEMNPGYQHNIYVGHIDTFSLKYSTTIDANAEGHELKSRAKFNFVAYNYIGNIASNDSRNIDLPNGGISIFIGNIIEQGNFSANNNLFGYGLEGLNNKAPHQVYLVNNTLINKKNKGNFIQVANGTEKLFAKNNFFGGTITGGLINGSISMLDTAANRIFANLNDAQFRDVANGDYNLTQNSPLIDQGIIILDSIGSYYLRPDHSFIPDTNYTSRRMDTKPDIGAYEMSFPSKILDHPYFQKKSGILLVGNEWSFTPDKSGELLLISDFQGHAILKKIFKDKNSEIIHLADFPTGLYYYVSSAQTGIIFKN
ncbi:MAG: hypothetical protein IPJ64_10750 [Saprospiraceae bacterium]|nr:hypothetical protein [Saprospiraceae bacterium]MBK7796832.1 hypothetical protein [Saprospiraceae bacterium]